MGKPRMIIPLVPVSLKYDENYLENKKVIDTSDDESLSSWKQDYFLPPTPDVIPLEVGQRLVAIGDIHGDFSHLRQCLKSGGIIGDDNDNWIGGNAVCVQVGDVLDRGYEEEECLLLLTKLARQAKDAGGAVVILWGNHEILNATCDFCRVKDSKAFEDTFSPYLDRIDPKWRENYESLLRIYPGMRQRRGPEMFARREAFKSGGLLAEPLLSKLKIAVQVGRTVLVHGGITRYHLDRCGGIAGVNRVPRDWILKTPLPPNHDVDLFFEREDKWDIILGNPTSPTLMRDYSHLHDKEPNHKEKVSAKVERVLEGLTADRIVVGHTTQDKINSILGGKVWRIDTGIRSRHEVLQVVCRGPDKQEEVSILLTEEENSSKA